MTCPECKTDTATIIGQHGEGRNKIRRYQCETCRLIFERTAREFSPAHGIMAALDTMSPRQ